MAGPNLFNNAFQLAYVTSDLDQAAALLKQRYGVGPFHFMRDNADGETTVSIGLAYAGKTNIELIEVSEKGRPLYAGWIPHDRGFSLRFHHIGLLVADEADWAAMRGAFVRSGTAIPLEGGIPGAIDYLYADTVADLGHYLEYIRLHEGGHAMFAAVPGYPGPGVA